MRKLMEDVESFEFVKLHQDHLDLVYNMYVENNSFWDDCLERQILSAERDYSYNDFISILQDEKVFGFVLNQKIPYTESNPYYCDDEFFIPVVKGFLVYEINNNICNILFLESESKEVVVYNKLLVYLQDRFKVNKKVYSIQMELFDENTNFHKMSVLQNNSFKEKKMIRASKGPDSFIFEFTQKSS